MKKLVSAFLCMTLILLASMVFAAQPLATDDTGTVGMRKFQIETSAEFGWDKETEHGITTKSNYQTLNATATAGLMESIDLVFGFPFSWQQIEKIPGNNNNSSGISDLSLAVKWRFLELGPTSFALKPSVTFPTGDHNKNLGAGRTGYGATLISTVEFKPVAVHANMGYTNQKNTDADKDGSREHLWNFSIAGTVDVLKGVQLVAEVGTASNPDKGSPTWPTFITGGVIYSALENLDIDLGVKGGLTSPETDKALLTGITYRFP